MLKDEMPADRPPYDDRADAEQCATRPEGPASGCHWRIRSARGTVDDAEERAEMAESIRRQVLQFNDMTGK